MKRLVVPVEQLSAETRQLSDVLNNESDLACVVIGAAFLDAALASLLGQKLIDSSVSRKLLDTNGALGSFATRADVAYCLGLISKTLYQDIGLVAQIRNRFAHHHLQLSFRDDTVRSLCDTLTQWRVLLTGPDEEKADEATVEQLGTRARNQFNISTILMANRVLLNALGLKHATG